MIQAILFMKKITAVIIILSMIGFFAGCRHRSVNTVSNMEVKAKITRIDSTRVDTDSYLTRRLILVDLRESKTNDGYMRVQAFFKNRVKSKYAFIYQFNWYDDQGVEVRNPDNQEWIRKVVVAGDDVTLTSIAPKRECRDFKLRLKEVKQ